MSQNANGNNDRQNVACNATQEPVPLSIEVMEERIAPGIAVNRCETLVDG